MHPGGPFPPSFYGPPRAPHPRLVPHCQKGGPTVEVGRETEVWQEYDGSVKEVFRGAVIRCWGWKVWLMGRSPAAVLGRLGPEGKQMETLI